MKPKALAAMPRAPREIWDHKGWRRVVAALGAAYCVVAWVLPIAVLAIVHELPLLQERTFAERLAISALGTAALVASMLVAFPGRVRIYRGESPWETTKNAAWALLGIGMFTAAAAAWSGNTFGIVARLLPGSDYSAGFTVIDVDDSGSRRYPVTLTLQPPNRGREATLALSRRLFDVPEFREGDKVVVTGKRTVVGVYVDQVAVRSR